MNKRLRAVYSGNVQGVGFRYTARSIAQGLGLTGWVRNVPDGTVEMVAEGDEKVLKELNDAVRKEMNYIDYKEQLYWEPGTGKFLRFEIRF